MSPQNEEKIESVEKECQVDAEKKEREREEEVELNNDWWTDD